MFCTGISSLPKSKKLLGWGVVNPIEGYTAHVGVDISEVGLTPEHVASLFY